MTCIPLPEHSGLKGTLSELAKALRRFAALPFDIKNLIMEAISLNSGRLCNL